jgi:radical SAM protein with 4Fe4S-binding SPASM domain
MSSNIDHKVICMMPWVHMHIWPNGDAFPCCMSDSQEVFGNVHEEPIDFLINNEKFKELRRQMINGERPTACSRCYELEDTANSWTLRRNSLESFKKHIPIIKETEEDGSISEFKMRYLDIRFSNLCNMKCRTCGPSLSSTWHEDQIILHPDSTESKFIDLKSNPDFMDDLKPHLDTIEEVYFAGGEALITPQHYEVLDYWLATGRTDVRLRYTTNFSALRYKDKKILDYWKKFEDVRVAASLDTHGERAEYARKGTIWKNIVANRKEMLRQCPDTYFEITPTVGIFSVHSLFDFHKSWVDQGLLNIDNIRVNILTHPRHFSITILPWEEKERVKSLYKEYVQWLKDNGANESTVNAVWGIVEYMYSADHSKLIPEFQKQIITIDFIRDENFDEIFTELKNL